MSTAHTAILMNMSDNKVLMMTVVDTETLSVPVPIGLIAVNTTSSIYSNNLPQMTLRMDEIDPGLYQRAERYGSSRYTEEEIQRARMHNQRNKAQRRKHGSK